MPASASSTSSRGTQDFMEFSSQKKWSVCGLIVADARLPRPAELPHAHQAYAR